jgi:hypothetical protein
MFRAASAAPFFSKLSESPLGHDDSAKKAPSFGRSEQSERSGEPALRVCDFFDFSTILSA